MALPAWEEAIKCFCCGFRQAATPSSPHSQQHSDHHICGSPARSASSREAALPGISWTLLLKLPSPIYHPSGQNLHHSTLNSRLDMLFCFWSWLDGLNPNLTGASCKAGLYLSSQILSTLNALKWLELEHSWSFLPPFLERDGDFPFVRKFPACRLARGKSAISIDFLPWYFLEMTVASRCKGFY